MSNKFNNRTLLLVFLGLAAILVITRFTSVKQKSQTLNTGIVKIDTAMATSIILYPRSEQGTPLEFERVGSSWIVSKKEIQASADAQSVKNLLTEMKDLQTEQLVARSPENWSDYDVTDSAGTRIIIKEGKKTSLDLIIGRFHYQPPPQGNNQMYGQNRVSGKTYIRLSEEDEVYAVDGFLAMSVNQPFERWRDQSVTRLNRTQLSKIIFDYPADSGFVAEKTEAGWMVAGLLADSASMASYLNGLYRKSHSEFADGFQPGDDPDFQVSFEGDNMAPQQVRAYQEADGQLILNSSINPDTWFRSSFDGIFRDLYPGSAGLIKGSDLAKQVQGG